MGELVDEVTKVSHVGTFFLNVGYPFFLEYTSCIVSEAVGRPVVNAFGLTNGNEAGEQGGVIALKVGRFGEANAVEEAVKSSVAAIG